MSGGLGIEGDSLHEGTNLLQRLKLPAVMEPSVARPDPANSLWLNVMIHKPDARVRGRLAGP